MDEMGDKLIALAIPVFMLSMVVEWALNRRHVARADLRPLTGGVGAYRLADTLTDLGAGIGQQALEPILKLFTVWAYAGVQHRFGLLAWDPKSPGHWLAAMVLVDLAYYGFHRASHRVNFYWAMHHVHHSSEDYNLAVALRQPWFSKLFDLPFYVGLAFLGLPVEMFLVSFTLNLLYQFGIHARFVPKLGALEKVFNTPSHHRVHHGVNPTCIDRNYGGILIIWDRLFGSFEEERFEPVYGTVKPNDSWNAAWANVVGFAELAQVAWRTRRWRDKLWIWLAPPEWKPADLGGPVTVPEPDTASRAWQGPDVPKARRFAVASFALVSGLLVAFLWQQGHLPRTTHALFAAGVVGLMLAWGIGLDGRSGARPIAWISLPVLCVAFPWLAGWSLGVRVGLAAAAVALATLAPAPAGPDRAPA